MQYSTETHTEEDTIAFGAVLAQRLTAGSVVALYGELGTGKTRVIKGICHGLGVAEHVASPTFTIINEYPARGLTVYHFDFYRIASLAEVRELGFTEYLERDGVCLIEWADRVRDLLPPRRLDLHLALGGDVNSRVITVEELAEAAA